jgi:STE24 endopeptidase
MSDGLILLLMAKSRLLLRVRNALATRGTRAWVACVVIAGLFILPVTLLQLPTRMIAAALWEDGGSSVDLASSLFALPASVMAGALALALVSGLAKLAPRWGWVWLGGFGAFIIFCLVLATPVTVTPRLRHDIPVRLGAASAPILAFVRRGGMRADELYTFNGANPADVDVEGLGALTHVAVSRAALAAPTPQTYAALGHLLGHYRHKDLWTLALLGSGFGFFIAGAVWRLTKGVARRLGEAELGGLGDPAALPAAALIVWACLPFATLAFNGFDRAINYRADDYALTLTRDPDAFCRWLVATEQGDKADPSRLEALLFYDHPPLKARLINAQSRMAAEAPRL